MFVYDENHGGEGLCRGSMNMGLSSSSSSSRGGCTSREREGTAAGIVGIEAPVRVEAPATAATHRHARGALNDTEKKKMQSVNE